jgi:superfamily II DNA helicase RecQ
LGSLQPSADPAIQERLAKSTVYFQEKFAEILSPHLETFSVETDNQDLRKQLRDAARQMREETAVKLACVLSCRNGFSPAQYLRALSAAAIEAGQPRPKAGTAMSSQADVGHPELFAILREWRNQKAAENGLAPYRIMHQRTLAQIAAHRPDSRSALKTIKGIGKRLAEKYGDELVAMVADYLRKHSMHAAPRPVPAAVPPPQKERD